MAHLSLSTAHPSDLAAIRLTLERISAVPLADWDRFADTAVAIHADPGTTVYQQGSRHPYIYFNLSGTLKVTVRSDQSERIQAFVRSREVITPTAALAYSLPAFRRAEEFYGDQRGWEDPAPRKLPAEHALISINEVHAVRFDLATLAQLFTQHLSWAQVGLATMSRYLISHAARMHDLLVLAPQQRYEKILTTEPDLVRLISQRDLAHLLGITPESLSRIAARTRDQHRESAIRTA